MIVCIIFLLPPFAEYMAYGIKYPVAVKKMPVSLEENIVLVLNIKKKHIPSTQKFLMYS